MGRKKTHKLTYSMRIDPEIMEDFATICKAMNMSKSVIIEDMMLTIIKMRDALFKDGVKQCQKCNAVYHKLLNCPHCEHINTKG